MASRKAKGAGDAVTERDERLDSLSGLWLANHRYQLGGFRAAGALCAVYDGLDDVLSRAVAIKVAPLSSVDTYQEALITTAGLSYPAFLAVYDALVQDERLFLVQEYVDGRPLSAYLADGTPVRRGVALALQMARAIAYAHQHDLTHGDLTPAAILIDRNAVAHINNLRMPPDWDYFAETVSALEQSDQAAPREETLAALRDDERLRDVWSVGAALWALISRGESDPAGGAGVSAKRVYREDVPPDVRETLVRTLNIAHPRRIAGADELALALEGLDEALSRGVARRDTLPLALRAYRTSRAAGDAGMATGLRRLIERHDEVSTDSPTYPGMTGPMSLDTSETRPADDVLMAAGAPLRYQQRPPAPRARRESQRPQEGAARPASQVAHGRGAGAFDVGPDLHPGWSAEYALDDEGGHVMQPWVWALIGVALFVAFFLIGYLVFPQLKLF